MKTKNWKKKYIINYKGKIEVEAETKKEAIQEAITGINYGLDDMRTEQDDFLELSIIEKNNPNDKYEISRDDEKMLV